MVSHDLDSTFFLFRELGQWAELWGRFGLTVLVVLLLGIFLYRRYLGISSGSALALVLLTIPITALFPLPGPGRLFVAAPREAFGFFPVFPSFLLLRLALVFFAVPFCAKLYLKWLHDERVNEAERQPGMAGVRAWLGGGNLVLAVGISALAAWNGFSFLSSLVVTVLALLAYPLLSTILQSPPLPEPLKEDLSPERDQVMKLLEAGKVTPEEASELLNALSQTVRSRESDPVPMTPSRRVVFLGVALLVLGFLLPWTRLAYHSISGVSFHATDWISSSLSGGTFPHGLGWVVLLLGVVAAALPYLTRDWDRYTQRNWILACLGIGGLVLLFVLLQTRGQLGIGLMLVMAGYTFELFGTLREYRPSANVARA